MTVHLDIAMQDRMEKARPGDGAAAVLLRLLKDENYRFVTPTPATHQRVLEARRNAEAAELRDALGWSLPFKADIMPAAVMRALGDAGYLEACGGMLRASVRVSSLGDDLFLHSPFPPHAEDTVFFGPDTYRFADFLAESLEGLRPACLVEIGTGTGAGAVAAARTCHPDRIVATDLNPDALALARINLAAAGVEAELRLGCGLEPLTEPADVIIANPPYISDRRGRTYRDGGDMRGARLSLDWSLAGADRLAPGGRFILYTGSAIVRGVDALKAALEERLDPGRYSLRYRELDPDVFGEEIGGEGYEDVERIAAVGAEIIRCR